MNFAGFDGVVLMAHGARDARWMEPFHKMRDRLEARLGRVAVALAFMEFASPTLGEAVGMLARGGCRRVLIVPIFLSGGGHVAKDIPVAVAPVAEQFPDISFSVSGALGEEPEVARAMADAVVRLVGG